jgi:hypothetical protein
MSLRWLPPGLAIIAVSAYSCANQGKGVGRDVIDDLCDKYYREAVERLHSPEGIIAEDQQTVAGDSLLKPTGSCAPLTQAQIDDAVAECYRNQIRAMHRCSREQQAALTCIVNTIEKAANRQQVFNDSFDCWLDVNKNGKFDAYVNWSLPGDAGVEIPDGAVWDEENKVWILPDLPLKGDEPRVNGEVVSVPGFCGTEQTALAACARASGPVETPDAGQP